MPVLVAYGSRQGATRGIADRVAEVLRAAGQVVDVRPVGTVGDLSGYDAFVVGGSVHLGRWHPEVVAFLRAHMHELLYRPVWLFSNGPTGAGTGGAAREDGGAAAPEDLASIAETLRPRDHHAFSAALPSGDVGPPGRAGRAQPGEGPRAGEEAADVDEVESWAREIARDLAAPSPGL
ncbi:flavodoxin domain-containing protein [Georgenia ruanii]|uniref:Flavodoxin n=1 Tax=Georgenia ruanii TaxID=348442 RepID=A0A7J9UZ27_9MICO|nr:flavodoxin domain-containing protein [Georgenia ruanii]MPV89891.1 flavodoxin [Georgenia ruanii]